MTAQEGDIQITPKRGIQIRKFDDAASHGLTHCMKSVDFIMERRDKILFIEIKDPDNPQAGAANRDRFIGEFASGSIDADLVYKCRDSFLYEWASGGVQKPVHYYVLIAVENLTGVDLLARTDALKRKIPLRDQTGGRWKRAPIAACAVFNIKTWNEHMTDCPARRISES
ncbi:MAG: hypothetical protein OXU71_12215 [Gammaproteobacteria bacterium]|nr:hypothetical protein [Gammaproteobacteria bacterium]